MDESLLTGESMPVRKAASLDINALDRPGGDDKASVFSGSLVTAGQGIAEVIATGMRSELGKIGKALQLVETEVTPLQKETKLLVRTFALVGLAACVLVVVVYGITRGGGFSVWKDGLLAGIAMAMAILPEEFPVILTVFLAIGAWRISRSSNVLTRRMPAVETLGAATVLCVDKTGTLTTNQMTLSSLNVSDSLFDLPEGLKNLPTNMHSLLETAVLASKPDPFDPMERALQVSGEQLLGKFESLHPQWSLQRQYPLTPAMLAVTHVWRADSSDEAVVAAKGAPEAIFALCHLDEKQTKELSLRAAVLAARGLRVLGVAKGIYQSSSLPEDPHDFLLEFVGLLGFVDPLRPTVPSAVIECQGAGIRVVMITGDFPTTAQSIARQAGLKNCDLVITGEELEAMSDLELAERIKEVQIFARVIPEQKLRLVNALKANNEIVAMTGDGVNDAPALKAAHIGIAMGARGTDVAREAASLVLLNDDFSSIVAAIREGRRIFDNIKKAVAFTLAVHVPIAGLSMLPVFLGNWPLLLLPVHIVFLELIIDPTCSLVFEAEEAEAGLMQRLPRNSGERLFTRNTVFLAVGQGLSILVVCMVVFVLAREKHSVEAARLLTFATLVTALLSTTLVSRSWTRTLKAMLFVPNKALRWVVAGAVVVLAVVLFVPAAQKLFHFAPVHLLDLGLSLGVGFVSVLWFDVVKIIQKEKPPRSPVS